MLLVMAGAALYQSRIEKTYTSSVSVAVDSILASGDKVSSTPGVVIDPLLINDPAVKQAAAETLQVPVEEVAGAVYATASGGVVTLTATAATPSEAQALANAYAGAIEKGMTSTVSTYLSGLQDNLNRITSQLEALQTSTTGTVSPLVAAQQSVFTAQYSAAFNYMSTASAVTRPVTVSGSAPFGILSSLPLLTVLEVALVAGLIAGVGLALVRNWLDGRVIDAGDARIAAELPVVGALPVDASAARAGRPTLIDANSANPAVIEDIRRMRTAVTSALGLQDGSVVVVTGTVEGDGASFVAANLAAASARAGKTTIIASGDLRRPDLTEYFGIVSEDGPDAHKRSPDARSGRRRSKPAKDLAATDEPSVDLELNGSQSAAATSSNDIAGFPPNGSVSSNGASNVRRATGLRQRSATMGNALGPERGYRMAVAEAAAYDVPRRSTSMSASHAGGPRLVTTGIDGLTLLPSLVWLGADVDALASARVREVIGALRTRADLVVLDAPPLFEFADPLILAGYADAVIVVSRSRRTRTRDLARAAGMLKDSDIQAKVAVVVNRIRRRRGRGTGAPIAPAPRHGQRRPRFQDLD